MFLYGKNSVLERLKTNPQSILKICLKEDFSAPEIEKIIKANKILSQRVSDREINNLKRADNLQGIIAQIKPFEYESLAALLNKPEEERLTLVCLDNVSDPHNLGAIIRTLACFGGFALVIPKHNSCQVNETVLHVASGGENYLPIALVSNLSAALIEAKKAGYWIAGAVVEEGKDISEARLPFPLCLVLGSEGEGIRYGIGKQLELKLSLPMKGASLSFNVSVACALFCSEINRQKLAGSLKK